MRFFKRLVIIALIFVPASYFYLKMMTGVESRRMMIADWTPNLTEPAESRIDTEQLMKDVTILSSDAFEGRGVGTTGGRKAREYVAQRFREIGIKPFNGSYFQPFSFVHHSIRALIRHSGPWKTEYSDAANVLGYIAGSKEPDIFETISAHYDHLGVIDGEIYNGADDDASGVSALLAIATYFQKHPPDHSMLFAAFDAEEEGLEGAAAFFRHPALDPRKIAADISLDMVSRNDFNRIFVSGTYPFPRLKSIIAAAAKRSPVIVLFGHDRPKYLAGSVESWIESSDHGEFYDAGIPFLYFGVEDHDDYHEPTDDADKIKPAYFNHVAELILDTAILLDHDLDSIRR